MGSGSDTLPDDVDALKAALAIARSERLAEAARAAEAEAALAAARAKAAEDQALIVHQPLQIAKLRRELYGTRAERAVARTTTVAAFTRQRPARQPFPEHLPRERVIVPSPMACPCCGSARL